MSQWQWSEYNFKNHKIIVTGIQVYQIYINLDGFHEIHPNQCKKKQK